MCVQLYRQPIEHEPAFGRQANVSTVGDGQAGACPLANESARLLRQSIESEALPRAQGEPRALQRPRRRVDTLATFFRALSRQDASAICAPVAHVPATHGVNVAVGSIAETEVRTAIPVGRVMARGVAGPREVGDLVVLVSCTNETIGRLQELVSVAFFV